MTLYPDHPGGVIACDAPGCHRTRRNYCAPSESDQWDSFQQGGFVRDLCPTHRVSGGHHD